MPIAPRKSESIDLKSIVNTIGKQNHTGDSGKIDSTRPSDSIGSDGITTEESGSAVGMKKKRTKTRSKQKNIRKDRRADHVKPPHLQIGSALYAGRPMTEVRQLLAIMFIHVNTLLCAYNRFNILFLFEVRSNSTRIYNNGKFLLQYTIRCIVYQIS